MYLDSAIIVKLVIHEPDSLFYARQLQGQVNVWTSKISLTECFSALCRKDREGRISQSIRYTAWNKIQYYIESKMLNGCKTK